MKKSSTGNVILGIGLELFMLGVATGVASINDEVGSIVLVFMIGLLILWLMYHVAVTNALPNLMAQALGKK